MMTFGREQHADGDADALLHAARQLVRIAPQHGGIEADAGERR